ncbi:MAG: AraC family transcriptional regulator [Clostridiaceae bacterium]
MKNQYISYGYLQNYIRDYYFRHKKRLTVLKAIQNLIVSESILYKPTQISFSKLWSHLSDEEFINQIYKLQLLLLEPKNILTAEEAIHELPETIFFKNNSDVFAYCPFRFTDDIPHTHNYFEIFYVFKGSCQMKFENELLSLSEGDLCIIAPDSLHSLIHDDEDCTVIAISIRKSTFDSAFFPLLTQKDLLSNFFRAILYNKTSSNYLLFFTDNDEDVKSIIKNLFMEYTKEDTYSNNGCISWVNLLFSFILRNYCEKVQFYKYNLSTDFHLIMQYIKQNYKLLTLSSLSNFFNYSEAHLSLIIKKNTGLSFIKLITSLKMSDAIDYLKNSDMSIEKISELTGYNSSDHFSRTFKQHYGCSPQQYRNSLINTILNPKK